MTILDLIKSKEIKTEQINNQHTPNEIVYRLRDLNVISKEMNKIADRFKSLESRAQEMIDWLDKLT